MSLLGRLGKKCADFFGEPTELDHMRENAQGVFDALDADYLSDLLPYRLFDSENGIYENKTSFGFCLEVIPLLGGSLEAQKEIASLIREIGEAGANIQTMMFADHRIDRFLQLWSTPRKAAGGIFAKVAHGKSEFLNQRMKKGDIPPRIFRFFFSYSEPKPAKHELPLFLEKMVEKRKKAFETFSRISAAFEMKPNQLMEILSGMVNFNLSTQAEATRPWDTNNWLSTQVCLPGSALEITQNGLIFQSSSDAAFMKTYEVVDFPDTWNLHAMGDLAGDFLNSSYRIPSPFYLHYGIHFPHQEKAEHKFRGKMKILAHQSKFSPLVRMFPDILHEMEENLFTQKQLAEGEKFVETRFSCGLWAAKEQFTKSESTLLALFQKYGFKLRENYFVHFPDFLSSLPMAWGEDSLHVAGLKRTRCMRTTLTHETSQLIPCVGEWWGNSNQGMILTGRKGQLASWDPFATDGNRNTVVVGPSGSGKSVFMQDMIMEHLGQGGRVFVLDLGRSFEKLCLLLGGQYLNFSEKSQFDLNPFSSINTEGGSETINAGLEMVSLIVATMASPNQKIDTERSDILNSLVKRAWEQESTLATVDTLIDLLGQMQFSSELMIGAAESLKEGLKKYSRQGTYANYFYGSRLVDFTKDIVVIETEELKNMTDLQAVILQIFTLTISNQIFMGDRNRRSLICIDEAWDLLKSPQMEGFIESLARRLRKYNGALVVGTQSITDFDRSYGAKAAFQNSNWLVMLGKDTDSLNALKKDNLIPMSEQKEIALSSLRMEAGKYSELFIYHKGSGSFSVKQLKLDPFSALLYSTKAEEFQAVSELQQKGFSMEAAIEWLLLYKSQFTHCLERGARVKEAIEMILGS
ncbi:MAG TPA: type IV secretion system protein TraC [Chlamydiales bacterium]|nr:type IV secretion system protein TraC [Chlamydiales bacterium]